MQCIVWYSLLKQEAKARIDRFLESLEQQESFPHGIKVKDGSRTWIGDQMKFSFKVKKGIAWATIFGTMSVADKSVVISAEIPWAVRQMVREDKIQAVITEKTNELLS
ncbi:polyhydroxyalkanoic acid system family protein [Candidatus Jorgensenbacteria bacterium]|nr:polyhydroxyalkanoic acid system family protein [Candidatus Jorgensenbacteria bacterium]